jgi:hypothetical protein
MDLGLVCLGVGVGVCEVGTHLRRGKRKGGPFAYVTEM